MKFNMKKVAMILPSKDHSSCSKFRYLGYIITVTSEGEFISSSYGSCRRGPIQFADDFQQRREVSSCTEGFGLSLFSRYYDPCGLFLELLPECGLLVRRLSQEKSTWDAKISRELYEDVVHWNIDASTRSMKWCRHVEGREVNCFADSSNDLWYVDVRAKGTMRTRIFGAVGLHQQPDCHSIASKELEALHQAVRLLEKIEKDLAVFLSVWRR